MVANTGQIRIASVCGQLNARFSPQDPVHAAATVNGAPVALCLDWGSNTASDQVVTCGGAWGSFVVYIGRITSESYTCVLCHKRMFGHGNNPDPACYHGKCCDTCNFRTVLPQRLGFAIIQEQLDECGI